MTFIASVPFQYDPNASGINDIPYVSGIESSMAWMDSVVTRHNLSGPLVDSSGFKWRKYYSEEHSERIYPQIAPPFALEGMPMNVSGFWGQFNEKIAFLGRETGGDYDNRPYTNYSNNIYWSGNYRDPVFPWAKSGQNTKPLPEGMFEYGQIDKYDFNTYIKKYAGTNIDFGTSKKVVVDAIGQGLVDFQPGVYYFTPVSTNTIIKTIVDDPINGNQINKIVDTYSFTQWEYKQDINDTAATIFDIMDLYLASGTITPGVSITATYYNGGAASPIEAKMSTSWMSSESRASGFKPEIDFYPGAGAAFVVYNDQINAFVSGFPADQVASVERYIGKNWTSFSRSASAQFMSKFATFAQAPTEVVYPLNKRLALQGTVGYAVSGFLNPYSVPNRSVAMSYGDQVLGYKMNNSTISDAGLGACVGNRDYVVYHNSGPVVNGTATFLDIGNNDAMYGDADTSNKYVWNVVDIQKDTPLSFHSGTFDIGIFSYFFARDIYRSGILVASGVTQQSASVLGNSLNGGGLGARIEPEDPLGTINGVFRTLSYRLRVPDSGNTLPYYISGVATKTESYYPLTYNQGAYRSFALAGSPSYSIDGPGVRHEVDAPIDIFNSGQPITGTYFSL